MTVPNSAYLERYLDDVDRVSAGRPGAVSEDRWLINNYDPDKLRLLLPYLEFDDRRVVAETISVLADVRERGAMDAIKGMSPPDDRVSMARLGYLTTLQQDDEAVPGLMDVLEHSRGQEFTMAARRMASIGRAEDIPALRKVYGQVGGTMRDDIRYALERIIARNPDLRPRSDLILSVPVYPNEGEFEEFLDKSIDYLDVRYRANVLPKKVVTEKVYSNVSRALRVMRTRLYNEADNLSVYGPDKQDRYDELAALLSWASGDLAGKEVQRADRRQARVCPKCGGMLTCYKGIWMCPECGGNLRPDAGARPPRL